MKKLALGRSKMFGDDVALVTLVSDEGMTSFRFEWEMLSGKKALKKERKDIDTFAHSLNQLDGGGNIFIQIIL
jgi:hypothetical protein